MHIIYLVANKHFQHRIEVAAGIAVALKSDAYTSVREQLFVKVCAKCCFYIDAAAFMHTTAKADTDRIMSVSAL